MAFSFQSNPHPVELPHADWLTTTSHYGSALARRPMCLLLTLSIPCRSKSSQFPPPDLRLQG